MEPFPGIAPESAAYKAAVLLLNENGMEPTARIERALSVYRTEGLPLTYAGMKIGGHAENRTLISSMSRRRSAVDLRALVGLRRLARRLLLHPKQAGRYLPMSPVNYGGIGGRCAHSGWATANRAKLLHFDPMKIGPPRRS